MELAASITHFLFGGIVFSVIAMIVCYIRVRMIDKGKMWDNALGNKRSRSKCLLIASLLTIPVAFLLFLAIVELLGNPPVLDEYGTIRTAWMVLGEVYDYSLQRPAVSFVVTGMGALIAYWINGGIVYVLF